MWGSIERGYQTMGMQSVWNRLYPRDPNWQLYGFSGRRLCRLLQLWATFDGVAAPRLVSNREIVDDRKIPNIR